MDLVITEVPNRRTPKGKVVHLTWGELKARLSDPVVTLETRDEYDAMTNEEKTEIKDIGGFVGGKLENGLRRKSALEYRSILTLDADDGVRNDPSGVCALFTKALLIHTTHTSTPDNLRLRYVFPLSRPVTPGEYTVLARAVMRELGEDFDDTTDQPERLMFWPSVCLDGDFRYWESSSDEPLDVDEYLDAEDVPETVQNSGQDTGNHLEDDDAVDASEGRRNKTVFSFAATLRGSGLDYPGIRSMVGDYNDRYCDPPLPEAELDTICRSVCSRYTPGEAVAPSLRDAWDDFNDLGEWEDKPKKVSSLSMESLNSLCSRHIDPPKFVVPNMIPYGITILASPPKFGKSWMCLDLALSVATGTTFLGQEVQKNGVIYLALEDGDYRLQDRSKKVAGSRDIPANLYLVKDAPILEDGLLPELNKKLNEVGGSVGLVIIDTLQKIRGTAKKTEGVYGYDYRELGQLHQFALDKNLAVVLVHHLNKGGDDSDFVSRLNGSTGVSGAADTIITLTRASRKSDDTKMSITGRDVQERTLVIKMDWNNFRWICLGDERDVENERDELEFNSNPIVKTILVMLQSAEDMLDEESDALDVQWRCSSTELMNECERLYGKLPEMSATALGLKIAKLSDQLLNKEGITYTYERTRNRREHVFTRELM